ncbi:hypothetical protein KC622_03600 [Candidatus Dojkabacteria bacterium]|uniref:Uncharacterized protein n=1 Tax=Candidatus Dojkabacteria bacterium TaxID=2099670 RepID=A0A955HZQ1_9BACT|nr:hypothetical protein [Candidatus Dojkabacteria bacterium]
MTKYFKLPGDFAEDIPNLSANEIKLYILLLRLRAMDSNYQSDDWIECSYLTASTLSGIKSNTSIRTATSGLAQKGWLSDYERGGFEMVEGIRVNRSTRYKISDKKQESNIITTVLKKVH